MLLTVISQTADILGDPQDPDRISENDSQLLYGEQFMVEESHGAYVYGHSILDNYKGYVEREQLVKNAPKANTIVKAKLTHQYPQPDFKSRPIQVLSFLSRLTVMEESQNGFTKLDDGNWVFSEDIALLDGFKMADDIAQTATIYLGTPYRYGGRSIFGIDCSGLVQQVLISHGQPCPPRDSKDQQGSIGTQADKENLQRNDIVYFQGHVGIMMDDRYILNATSRHMNTILEDVRDLEKIYGGITYVSRV
jgi:cell wall-associated NlpC family hydrolase